MPANKIETLFQGRKLYNSFTIKILRSSINFFYLTIMKNYYRIFLLFLGLFSLASYSHADVGQSFKIPSQTGEFTLRMTVIPTEAMMDGVVGLGPVVVGTWGDFNCIVRFSDAGIIDARNGGTYGADVELPYEAGKKYYVQISANVETKLYSVLIIGEDGTEVVLARDYAFRDENYTGTIDYLSVRVNDTNAPWTLSVLDVQFGTEADNEGYDNFYMALDNPASGDFGVKLRATPSFLPMNGSVGLSKIPVLEWGDYNLIVLFAPDSTVKVRNGSSYEADTTFKYEAGVPYTLFIWGNTDSLSYNVNLVTVDGQEIVLAENYEFRLSNPGDTLNYLNQRISLDPLASGVPGSYVAIDGVENGELAISEVVFTAIITEMEEQTEPFSLTFAATPSDESLNATISFNDSESIVWGDMSAIVRFGAEGVIDARNGGAYEYENEILYKAGQTYIFTVDFDVPGNKYTVSVKTDLYAEPDTIGTDYAFRKTPVTSLNYITYKSKPLSGTLTVNDAGLGTYLLAGETDTICKEPTIDDLDDLQVASGEGEIIINLTGITSGAEDTSQNITITATSSNSDAVTASAVLGTGGEGTLTLVVNEVSEATDVTISVTVSDDCDVDTNGGIASLTKTFMLSVAAPTAVNNEVLSSLNIYPNPVSGILSISNASDVTRIEVIGMQGKSLLHSLPGGDETVQVNMNHLNPGLYLIRFFNGEGKSSSHVIVKQ